MQTETCHNPSCTSSHVLKGHLIKGIIIALLFISSIGIRLYHITVPPLDFSLVRQYQNAHNARAYYLNSLDDVSEEKKKIADINMKRMEFKLEPRIMEYLAVIGYHTVGGEKLWIPRVISSIFWVIGGLFLFLLTLKIADVKAAVFSAAFYLFLPYGITASRIFQPDPMMIMTLMISFYSIVHYHERPSKYRLLAAAGASALAMFVKPYCVFLVFGLFIALAIKRHKIRELIFNADLLLFSFMSVIPAMAFYVSQTLGKGDVALHAQITFLPHLYLESYFWKDWLLMIGKTTGFIAFAGALAGLLMSRGLLRAVLSGLWIGYFFFGLVFTYHIHTHSYYQLQFIPVAALSLIPVAAWIKNRVTGLVSSKKFPFYLMTIVVLAALCSGYVVHSVNLSDYKRYLKPVGAVIGINPEFYHFLTNNYAKEVKMMKKVGEIVNHGTNNVFLTIDYGRALAYHGELSGLPWPTKFSMLSRAEMGVPIPDKEELFNTRYLTVRTHKSNLFDTETVYGDYIKYTPDYFIVLDFEEFDLQPDLKQFLYDNFPVLARGEGYLIFDLRSMSE